MSGKVNKKTINVKEKLVNTHFDINTASQWITPLVEEGVIKDVNVLFLDINSRGRLP